MTTTHTHVGDILRKGRAAKSLYLDPAARALGLSVSFVSDVERGRRVLPDARIDEWAALVGVDPDVLRAAKREGDPVYRDARDETEASIVRWLHHSADGLDRMGGKAAADVLLRVASRIASGAYRDDLDDQREGARCVQPRPTPETPRPCPKPQEGQVWTWGKAGVMAKVAHVDDREVYLVRSGGVHLGAWSRKDFAHRARKERLLSGPGALWTGPEYKERAE